MVWAPALVDLATGRDASFPRLKENKIRAALIRI